VHLFSQNCETKQKRPAEVTNSVCSFSARRSFSADNAMQKKWTAFCKKVNTESNFGVVLETIRAFLLQPFQAVISGADYTKNWVVSKQMWE
jgi:hypothetical protein